MDHTEVIHKILYRARADEDAGNWRQAAAGYAYILQVDATYRDAASRKQACDNSIRHRPKSKKAWVIWGIIAGLVGIVVICVCLSVLSANSS